MSEITVTAEHMKALQALAGVNLSISDARNSLSKLQETETEYLVSREKKAMDRIQATFNKSTDLLEQTNKNYELVEDFAKSVEGGAAILSQAVQTFQEFVRTYETYQNLRDRDIKNQEETIKSLSHALKIEGVFIESKKSVLETALKKLGEDIAKVDDDRAELDRAINRLKEGKI